MLLAGLLVVTFLESSISMRTLCNGMQLSKIGIGTWAWGDQFFWKYESGQDKELQETFNYCQSEGGVSFYDTAEIYGLGRSELLLGRFKRGLKQPSDGLVYATKFAPLPFRLGSESVVVACETSLDRMGIDNMGLYQIHWPSLIFNDAYWDGLARCYEKGLIKSVGVSNYGPELMKKAHKYLSERGIPLATNQVQYSLLCRSAETNDLLATAKDLNVTILGYSPLAQGILTGKFSSTNLPEGPRRFLTKSLVEKAAPLLEKMKTIATAASEQFNMEVTPSQVAINYCIAKDVVPLPGARSLRQAKDNCNALRWVLSEADVQALDAASAATGINIPTPLQSR